MTIPAVLITFDDGYENNYTLAYPALSSYNINATVYMISNWIGGVDKLSAAQLQALNSTGWDIGNHTKTHPHLGELTVGQQEAELVNCKNDLDAIGLSRASSHVAYPFGDYNTDTLTAMGNVGMLTGRIYDGSAKDGFLMSDAIFDELVSIEIKYTTSLNDLTGLIDYAICLGKICVLVFHEITTGVLSANKWSVDDLTLLAAWINQKNLVSLTISQLHTLRSGNLEYTNPWYI